MLARKEYSELRIVESEVIKNAKNIRAYLGTFISTESVNPASFSRIGGRALGTAAGAGNDFIDQLQHTKKFQSALMKGDTMSKLKEVFGSLKILKLPRLADKVALYFKDTDSAINTLRQAGASGGTFLAEMFRSLPTVGLIIGGVDISMSNSRDFEGSKLRELGTIAAQVLVPFVGPVMLMTDPNTALTFKKDGQIENLGTGIAAVGMVGLDLCLLGKALGKGIPGGVEFFMERPKDVLRVFRGITRTGTLISRAAPRLVGAETAVAIEKILVK